MARPHHVPYVLDAEDHPEGAGVDALYALTLRMRDQDPTWRNQLGWLVLDGRRLELMIETTPGGHEPVLETSLRHRIAETGARS